MHFQNKPRNFELHPIRNYRNAQDLTGRSRNSLVIDLYGLSEQETLSKFPTLYQHVYETVKPERDHNNRLSRREKWWLFGETNPKLREILDGLDRYIVTAVTAKHRIFQFLSDSILPDDALVAIGLDDAYYLGTPSSEIYTIWTLNTGGTQYWTLILGVKKMSRFGSLIGRSNRVNNHSANCATLPRSQATTL